MSNDNIPNLDDFGSVAATGIANALSSFDPKKMLDFNLFSLLTSIPLIGAFFAPFTFNLSNLWKGTDFEKTIDEASNKITGLAADTSHTLLVEHNPDFLTAQNGSKQFTDNKTTFTSLQSTYGLTDDEVKKVQELERKAADKHFANGIPKDKKLSAKESISLKDEIYTLLAGDGSDGAPVGLLYERGISIEQGQKIAADTAKARTGVPEGATVASLILNQPAFGIAGTWMRMSKQVNADGFQKGSLTASDAEVKLDTTVFAALHTNKNINNPKDVPTEVATSTPPSVSKKPAPATPALGVMS